MDKKLVKVWIGIIILAGNSLVFCQSKKIVESKKDTIRYCSGTIVSIIESDLNGQYHGKLIRYYRSGKPSEIFNFNHGILDGKSVYFFESGDTSMIESYKNGVLHGITKGFYPNNKVMFMESYYGGTFQNDCGYFEPNGNAINGILNTYSQGLVRKANCINGKPEGDLLIFGEVDCQLYQQIPFKSRQLDGRMISYKSNGTKERACLYEQGKYIKEDDSLYFENIKTYSQLLQIDSSKSNLFYLRGLANLRIGKKENCLKDLEKVTKLDPKNYKAFYNRGVILADTIPLKAINEFKKCNAIQPDFYIAHHNLGLVYFKQKDYKRAIESLNKALLYKPNFLPSINNLGLIYDITKDHKKADQYWKLAESFESN
jgi:antitoxin component YwqK of YwqJK toxin-antitoxin module